MESGSAILFLNCLSGHAARPTCECVCEGLLRDDRAALLQCARATRREVHRAKDRMKHVVHTVGQVL